jgi:hypothetical protein
MTTPLPPEALRRTCPIDALPFETTDNLEALDEIVAQDRAVQAITFGVRIRSAGFNLFALGPPGTGKATAGRRFLTREAAKLPTPADWCYVYNFAEPHRPRAIRLQSGRARIFQRDCDRLIDDVKTGIPRAFEAEPYEQQKNGITQGTEKEQAKELAGLKERVEDKGFGLGKTPSGLIVVPILHGKPLDTETLRSMDEAAQQEFQARVYRSNRVEELLQDLILQGTLLIDTQGVVVGQVNGIAVIPLGDYLFGKPSRITARTFLGRGGVLDIEREAKTGGRIHSKGVLILSGYLGGRYASQTPLALGASVAFEQLYEEVEGDSASSAELYAILSSLAELPIRQSLAVTGSVNQHGEVQAIGGANAKIEGFFDVCRARGFTGDQGVLILQSNVRNLMVREDVIEAVREGKFHVYPVRTIDEGIALLTGVPAGDRGPDGAYPDGSVNYRVLKRLREMAEQSRAFRGNGESAPARGDNTEGSPAPGHPRPA